MAVNPVINLTINQGADFSEVFLSKESDGSATDLTGYSGSAKIRKHYGSSTATAFTVSITASTGEVSIAMTSGKTVGLSAGRHVYDVRLVSSGGDVSRLVEGMAVVQAGVTTS